MFGGLPVLQIFADAGKLREVVHGYYLLHGSNP